MLVVSRSQTVEWDELRFDVRLLQRVPYEGISRMQTSLRRRHRDRVVRRGSMFQLQTNARPWKPCLPLLTTKHSLHSRHDDRVGFLCD